MSTAQIEEARAALAIMAYEVARRDGDVASELYAEALAVIQQVPPERREHWLGVLENAKRAGCAA